MRLPPGLGGDIELGHQGAQLLHTRGIIGTHQQAVGAQVRHHHQAIVRTATQPRYRRLTRLGRDLRTFGKTPHQLRQVDDRGVHDGDDGDIGAARLVDLLDDLQDIADAGGGIGDHQHIARRIHGQQGRGRHQRTQHGHQLRRRGVLHHHDMGGPAITVARVRGTADAGVQLGLRLGHDLDDTARTLHRGKTLGLQGGDKYFVGRILGHRLGGNDGDLALHPRVEEKITSADLGNGFDHGLDIGILEVEQHLSRLERFGRHGGRDIVNHRGRWEPLLRRRGDRYGWHRWRGGRLGAFLSFLLRGRGRGLTPRGDLYGHHFHCLCANKPR